MAGPCQACQAPTKMLYPGLDPENGPARPYCAQGHSICYCCSKVFLAIELVPEQKFLMVDDDPTSVITISASRIEHDCCPVCEDENVLDDPTDPNCRF